MAVPEPPRTLKEWRQFEIWCIGQGNPHWVPGAEIDLAKYPAWFVPERWEPLAEGHPFKGTNWCWRCLAEAQGRETGRVPHVREERAICWGSFSNARVEPEQAAGNTAAEDTDSNSGLRRTSIEVTRYFSSEAVYKAEHNSEGAIVNLSTRFREHFGAEESWPPPGWSFSLGEAMAPDPTGPDCWVENPFEPWAPVQGYEVPARADESEWEALPRVESLPPHEPDAADRQPGTDDPS